MFQIEGRHLKGCLFFIVKSPPISVGGLYLITQYESILSFSLKFYVIIHIHENSRIKICQNKNELNP